MLVATVTVDGKPAGKVRVAFSVLGEGGTVPLDHDDTIEDGTAAVRFPEGVPGGPGGELRVVGRITAPPAHAGFSVERTLPGGVPGPAVPWGPRSRESIVAVSVTLLAGICAAIAFARLNR